MSYLKPAGLYKELIEHAFDALAYTDKMLWYTGSIENYPIEIKQEGDKYAYAIVFGNVLIGYISFRVDWYCSMAFNFSLIKFEDTYFDTYLDTDVSTTHIMASAIREVIKMIKSYNLHRIDFRCVGGNPAFGHYVGIVNRIETSSDYSANILCFRDNIRDTHGDFHSTYCFELIHQ